MTACNDDTRPRESKVVTAVVVGERENKQQLTDVMERIKKKCVSAGVDLTERLGEVNVFS